MILFCWFSLHFFAKHYANISNVVLVGQWARSVNERLWGRLWQLGNALNLHPFGLITGRIDQLFEKMCHHIPIFLFIICWLIQCIYLLNIHNLGISFVVYAQYLRSFFFTETRSQFTLGASHALGLAWRDTKNVTAADACTHAGTSWNIIQLLYKVVWHSLLCVELQLDFL